MDAAQLHAPRRPGGGMDDRPEHDEHGPFREYYQIGRGDEPDSAQSEPKKTERELKGYTEPAHSPFGLVGQIARDTGWSVDYIMRGVNYPMLMLMWQDFPAMCREGRRPRRRWLPRGEAATGSRTYLRQTIYNNCLTRRKTLMNPIKLEIFLDDKTLAGMRSVEGNVANMEAFTRRMIGHLKLELKDLEKEYKNLQKQGLAGERRWLTSRC